MADPANDEQSPQLVALERLLRSEDWKKKQYGRLLLAAKPLARGTRLGPEDLVQNALLRVWNTSKKGEGPTWAPDQGKALVAYLAPILLSERSNALKSAYNRNNVLARHQENEEGELEAPDYAHPEGDALDVFQRDHRIQRGDARAVTIRARLDPLAQDVFDRMLSETLDPEALASELGEDVETIYAAQRRANYHTKVVLDADPDSDKKPK